MHARGVAHTAWRRWPATGLLAALTVVVSVGSWALTAASLTLGNAWGGWLWNTPQLVSERGWLWQVVTANFVHGGVLHLTLNLFFLLWLGPRLEGRLGSRQFALFYLGAGVFAYAVYDLGALLAPGWGTSGGASGCVLAVATLYTLCFPRHEVHLYGLVRVPFRWIVILFVVSDASTFWLPGGIPWVNTTVHLGGVAFAVLYWALFLRREGRP